MRTKGPSPKVSEAVVARALRDYERERISLGRLAELLGIDRAAAAALVESHGMRLRVWPATVEEARQDARAAEDLP